MSGWLEDQRVARAVNTLRDLLLRVGVDQKTLNAVDEDTLVRNHLLCSFEVEYDPNMFHPRTLEDDGWGDSIEVAEIIGVQFGSWGRGRGGKCDHSFSFGVYEITPLETRLAKGAFGRPATGPPRLIKPRPAKDRVQRVVRVCITDSDGDHILEQALDVQCTEAGGVVSHVSQWDLHPGPVVIDVCGLYQSWISVIFTDQEGFQFYAAWSRENISKQWWTAYAWTTRNLSHHGCDHIYWTGVDESSWLSSGVS